jgi:hypothetical protein
VEVWDNEYLTRYKQSKTGIKGVVNGLKDYFGMDGYEVVYRSRHGFSRCPIHYKRDKENGPCWNKIQCLIDDYEVALSYFAKNNAGAALPSYKLKGDDIDIQGDPLGRIRAFTMGKDDDVSILQPQQLSENYCKYIEYLLTEIFQGAFIVKHPELKSGDTPTGTMKLYYAPSLDKAELDAKDYQRTVTDLQSLFCEGYGIEQGAVTEYLDLNDRLYGWIMPFVHENNSSLIADLVAYTEKTTGEFRPGTGNAGISASDKLGNGLGAVLFGFALSAAGFDAALKVQPAAVNTTISAMFIWVPALSFAAVLVIYMLFFDIERIMNE